MQTESLHNYAKIILQIGVNLQPGQNLLIRAEPYHWPFLSMLAEEAYKLGARYVRVQAEHPALAKVRAAHARDAYLKYVPDFIERDIKTMLAENWAIVNIAGMEDPEVNADMNQARHATIRQAVNTVLMPYFNKMIGGACPWVIAPVPTPRWAAKVFDSAPADGTLARFWRTLTPILKLNEADPVQAWRQQSAALKDRADRLNTQRFDAVVFRGPGTELQVGLGGLSVWTGGLFAGVHGREFLPNLPTYEIFTTPDCRETTGRVQVTRPVEVLGSPVEQAWFEFDRGAVVDYGAARGRELLDHYFEVDARSRYLGEVALVDISSPIFQAGRRFHSILLDENAACHIALGRGLPIAVKGGMQMSDEALAQAGCNIALQHTDFMISSETVSVFGCRGDSETLILDRGRFVI